MLRHGETPWLPVILFLSYKIWALVFFCKTLALIWLSRPAQQQLTENDVRDIYNKETWKRSMGMGPN